MISSNLKTTLQNALSISNQYSHKYATSEHLLLALLDDEDSKIVFQEYHINTSLIENKLRNYLKNDLAKLVTEKLKEAMPSTGFQRIVKRAILHSQANGNHYITGVSLLAEFFLEQDSYALSCLKESNLSRKYVMNISARIAQETPIMRHDKNPVRNNDKDFKKSNYSKTEINNIIDIKLAKDKTRNKTEEASELNNYCVNLNAKAKDGGVDCLIGRQLEIQRTIEILCRRRKNNALLVGEPGVGKTAIAEGLALRIVKGDVPDILKNSVIYSLEIGNLVAGAKYRGDFEDKIKKLLTEIKNRPEIILFIDEVHTIVGAGSTTSASLDASDLLKPSFARGEIRCIGATTFKEYHNYFEQDMALVRRFQKVVVTEPDEEGTIKILKGLKKHYEDYHKVIYDDSALSAAAILSERYIHDRNLPDKAIDLIDEAGARKAIIDLPIKSKIITAKDIEELVASISNIPNIESVSGDIKKLQKLENNLKKHIFGQDEAIFQLCASIKLSRAGLKKTHRPTGCYLFAGATGVGKTELAKLLAKFNDMELIKFDMSEYTESNSIAKLLGSPPGYVGFNQGGLLTDSVDKFPYSVVLFDEIEKAHPEILNILLQIMDEGTLTDNTGKSINFTHTIVILTTNLGAQSVTRAPIGFGSGDNRQSQSSFESIHEIFTPELRNRLDKVIIFNPINNKIIDMIVEKNLKELKEQLRERNVEITVTKSVNKYLIKNSMAHENGARILDRIIDSELKHLLADEILFGKLKQGGNVAISYNKKDNKLNFTFQSMVTERQKSPIYA
jgi:ATP-dependent Clp protease ATP-binding subunit ClpA